MFAEVISPVTTVAAEPDAGSGSVLGAAMTALAFYTRVPRPAWSLWCAEDAAHAGAFAPLAGVLVAAAGSVVWWLAARGVPEPLPVILAVAAMIGMTGALHEDGLADVCDAFGAGVGGGAARTLDILKDPRLGVYGVLGLVLVMAVRIAALWQIARLSHGDWTVMAASLIAAHASSRFAAVYLTRNMDYVRADDGRSRVAAFASPLRGMWLRIAAASTLLAVLPLLALGLLAVLWALPVMIIAAGWLRALFRRRIGGYTGDCLGCVQQVTEAIAYLAVVAALFDGATL
jgi:adenosylcobinamide-GDP ribazoletransferase